MISLQDGTQRILVRGATAARYVPSGHLLYVDQGTLFAVRFDLTRVDLTGTPATLLNDVSFAPGFASAEYDVSDNGTLVYRRTAGSGQLTIDWLEGSGKVAPLLRTPGRYLSPSLSPDGKRIAFSQGSGGDWDLWIYEWQRDQMTRVTSGGNASAPLWTPDARFLIASHPTGGLVWIRADGGGNAQTLIASGHPMVPWSFPADGKRLAYYERDAKTFDLWTVPLNIGAESIARGLPQPFVVTDAFEFYPTFSPDGKWIAYTSLESGTYEVYARTFPDTGRKWRVSNRGGSISRWSADGRRIFYRSNGQIMMTEVTAGGNAFKTTTPRLWQETRLGEVGVFPNFDITTGGDRVAALLPAGGVEQRQDEHHLTFVLNLFGDLRRRTAPKQ